MRRQRYGDDTQRQPTSSWIVLAAGNAASSSPEPVLTQGIARPISAPFRSRLDQVVDIGRVVVPLPSSLLDDEFS